jgi:hypothetical protein
MNELKPDVANLGTFILLKTIKDSYVMTSILFLVEDPEWSTLKVGIYNAKFNFVPEGSWLVIKEPYLKMA